MSDHGSDSIFPIAVLCSTHKCEIKANGKNISGGTVDSFKVGAQETLS